jgi:hypothetical protein
MTKRMLIVSVVLALVAGMIIPAAVIANGTPTTTVTGNIVEAELTVAAPSAIAFGNFFYGNNTQQSATNGTVTVTPGSRNTPDVPWLVTAKDEKVTDPGYMTSGGNKLFNKLQISKDGSTYPDAAPTGVTYSGNGNGVLPFWAKQNVVNSDPVGNYTITITFTGQLDW